MAQIKAKNTRPELLLRKLLYNAGYRYRICYKIKGKPDIAFPKYKIAIFIHGCFWHNHTCKYASMPKTNTLFWKNKLKQNKKRDKNILDFLSGQGWHIKTVWECQLESDLHKTSQDVIAYLSGLGLKGAIIA